MACVNCTSVKVEGHQETKKWTIYFNSNKVPSSGDDKKPQLLNYTITQLHNYSKENIKYWGIVHLLVLSKFWTPPYCCIQKCSLASRMNGSWLLTCSITTNCISDTECPGWLKCWPTPLVVCPSIRWAEVLWADHLFLDFWWVMPTYWLLRAQQSFRQVIEYTEWSVPQLTGVKIGQVCFGWTAVWVFVLDEKSHEPQQFIWGTAKDE